MSTKIQVKVPRWLFIHIPKTGGTFFKRTLRKDQLVENQAHAFPFSFTVDGWKPMATVYKCDPDLKNMPWNKNYPFPPASDSAHPPDYVTVVRNPFALLYSYWRYIPQDKSDWEGDVSGFANCNNVMGTHTFHGFIEHYIDPEKKWHIPPLKKNIFAQIYSDHNMLIPKMENILRCETLDVDAARWCERNRIRTQEVPAHRRNINPIQAVYKDKYTPLQVKELRQVWSQQLETFGYDF